jgi:Lrp/AsnC family leucine-responsive transcriptional regulator
MFDEIDKTIISELQRNGRATLTHMAGKVGISHVAVRKRLEKLLKKEIVDVCACINPEQLNAKIGIVMVEVENYPRLRELMELFKDCPRVLLLSSLSASNLIMVIFGENLSTLESTLGVCSIRVHKGVRRSEVYIGDLPAFPRFLPIRIYTGRKSEMTPCGAECETCISYEDGKCYGCPSTIHYNGPL